MAISYQGPCRFVFKGDDSSCSKLTRKARTLLGTWDTYLNAGNGSMSGFNRIKVLPDGSTIQGIRVNGMYMAVITALRVGCGNDIPGLYYPSGGVTLKWSESEQDFIASSVPAEIVGGKKQLISHFYRDEENLHYSSESWYMPDPEDSPEDIVHNRIPDLNNRLAQMQKPAYDYERAKISPFLHKPLYRGCESIQTYSCMYRYITMYNASLYYTYYRGRTFSLGGVDSGLLDEDYILKYKYIGSLVTMYKGQPVIYKLNLTNVKDIGGDGLSDEGEDNSDLFNHLRNDYNTLYLQLYRSPIDYCNPKGMVQFTTVDSEGVELDREVQDYGTLVDEIAIDVSAYTTPDGTVRTTGDEFFLIAQLISTEITWNTYQKRIGEPITGAFLFRQGIKKKLGDEDWNYDVDTEYGNRGTVTRVIELSISSPEEPEEEAELSFNIVEVSDSFLGKNIFEQDEVYKGTNTLNSVTVGPDEVTGATTFDYSNVLDVTKLLDINKYSVESVGYFEGQINILKHHYTAYSTMDYDTSETTVFSGKTGPNQIVNGNWVNHSVYNNTRDETGCTLHLRIADSFADIWSGNIRIDVPYHFQQDEDWTDIQTQSDGVPDGEGVFTRTITGSLYKLWEEEYYYVNAEHTNVVALAVDTNKRIYAYGITEAITSDHVTYSSTIDSGSWEETYTCTGANSCTLISSSKPFPYANTIALTEDIDIEITIKMLVINGGTTVRNEIIFHNSYTDLFDNPDVRDNYGNVIIRHFGEVDQSTVTIITDGKVNNINEEALSNGTSGLKMVETLLKTQATEINIPYIRPNSFLSADPTIFWSIAIFDNEDLEGNHVVTPGTELKTYMYTFIIPSNDGTMARKSDDIDEGTLGVAPTTMFQLSIADEYIFSYRTTYPGDVYTFFTTINDVNYEHAGNINHLPTGLPIRGF